MTKPVPQHMSGEDIYLNCKQSFLDQFFKNNSLYYHVPKVLHTKKPARETH
jgi:hypothetical protein